MTIFYRTAYWLGLRPWEHAARQEAARISAFFDREEAERQRPYGRAFDVGCGTGMQSVELAQRGWQVTGVDIVSKALRAARERARQAGVEAQFVEADITALGAAGIGTGFRFVLDFGCFHGLPDVGRTAMAREVTTVTDPGATMLMIAWTPGRRGPLPRGASREDIEAAFVGWTIIAENPLDACALPGPLRGAEPRCYRLRRA